MYKNLRENIIELKRLTGNSADFTIRTFRLNNIMKSECAVVTTEGMCNKEALAISVINPILHCEYNEKTGKELFKYIFDYMF